jgi:hypothetical protein
VPSITVIPSAVPSPVAIIFLLSESFKNAQNSNSSKNSLSFSFISAVVPPAIPAKVYTEENGISSHILYMPSFKIFFASSMPISIGLQEDVL